MIRAYCNISHGSVTTHLVWSKVGQLKCTPYYKLIVDKNSRLSKSSPRIFFLPFLVTVAVGSNPEVFLTEKFQLLPNIRRMERVFQLYVIRNPGGLSTIITYLQLGYKTVSLFCVPSIFNRYATKWLLKTLKKIRNWRRPVTRVLSYGSGVWTRYEVDTGSL